MTTEERIKRIEDRLGIKDATDDGWPPAGVAIEVWDDDSPRVIGVSAGDGRFWRGMSMRCISGWEHWRYHVPPWPDGMEAWLVVSDGTTFFSPSAVWSVGEESGESPETVVTIVAVIRREDLEAER